MRVAVVTLFPAMFEALTGHGISSRAVQNGLMSLSCINPRDYVSNKHGRVDDRPYGGGPGMVMSVPPLRAALHAAQAQLSEAGQAGQAGQAGIGGQQAKQSARPLCVYLSPQGEPLTQQRVEQLAGLNEMVLLCGRYEGVDERLLAHDVDLELSLGDYVISGGELAAMVLLDAVIRLQPGALGDEDSAGQDSFSGSGLLDCPHYTRPEQTDGQRVPKVLLGGDHAAIANWRLEQSLLRTLQRRPDVIAQLEPNFGPREREILARLRQAANS